MENGEGKIENLPQVTFQRASVEDIDTYIKLEKSVGNTKTYSAMLTPEEAREEIEKSVVYFIKEGNEIVGSISYVMKNPDHAYIDGLLVHPSYQNHGLGRAAMVKILAELPNVKLVDLVTHPDNAPAIKLYESLGFTIGERIENYFGDGEPRIVMMLKR